MLVTRYNKPVYKDRRFDIFNELLNSFNEGRTSDEPREIMDFVPSVNTREASDAYYIEIDLPGVKKEDVDVSVDKNVLTISGKRESSEEVKEDDYYRVESAYGKFSRSFTLPENVDVEKIQASSEDGVLEITIPKQEVIKDSTKKIKIQ
ncbi:Hsp20/alpha crystallin family protein [Sulfurimonas sp.]|uniref:Hsp20/alpha crystallin family protein n=1 Tax=Sulfurimonas sp. TaxID=2022749 RepID=UPI0026340C9E|nr:Hsp20/alpha crystallin family protein [Sulfurimonas sp.]